jgi:hypothetical protein
LAIKGLNIEFGIVHALPLHRDGRIVHQGVEPAELRHDAVDERRGRGRIGLIRPDRDAADAPGRSLSTIACALSAEWT